MNFKKTIFTVALIAAITSVLFFSSCNTGTDSADTTTALTDALLTYAETTNAEAATLTNLETAIETEEVTIPAEEDSESVFDTVTQEASTTKPEEVTTMSEEDMIKAEYEEFFPRFPTLHTS